MGATLMVGSYTSYTVGAATEANQDDIEMDDGHFFLQAVSRGVCRRRPGERGEAGLRAEGSWGESCASVRRNGSRARY